MPMPDDPNPHCQPDHKRTADKLASGPDGGRDPHPSKPCDSPAQTAEMETAVSEATTESLSFDSSLDLGSSVFQPGEVVADRFRVIRYLARGGMGELYEAEDLELRERVALKTILPKISVDERQIHLLGAMQLCAAGDTS
jgi:hypothetical protein